MVTVVRAARVLLLLVLAVVTVSLLIALVGPYTGSIEKVALGMLIASCVYLAARLPGWATLVEARLHAR